MKLFIWWWNGNCGSSFWIFKNINKKSATYKQKYFLVLFQHRTEEEMSSSELHIYICSNYLLSLGCYWITVHLTESHKDASQAQPIPNLIQKRVRLSASTIEKKVLWYRLYGSHKCTEMRCWTYDTKRSPIADNIFRPL